MKNEGAEGAVFRALLQPSGRSFTVAADQTLLAAALGAGIALPSSCRNGTCRTCLAPLHAGRVHYRIAWPGLLPEERASGGCVLPCVAYPLSDVEFGEPPA
ncbi:MAG TPA: 2Fe-2S iron-sulfur cluster-binding protein [Ramlibacter sp.]|jgi:ferredoxin|nr:2Fe-2S iron-sulfur cluster-binding protein [Ramlibacter sp.]